MKCLQYLLVSVCYLEHYCLLLTIFSTGINYIQEIIHIKNNLKTIIAKFMVYHTDFHAVFLLPYFSEAGPQNCTNLYIMYATRKSYISAPLGYFQFVNLCVHSQH